MTECDRIIKEGILPESFFEEEIQCDFCVSKKRKKVWAISLDLLIEFDRVCRKHGLKYYLIAGSLLGACRHQGFIPWDDDADVVMFREDYDKLCSLSYEFESPYFLQTPYTDEDYYYSFAKLRNSNTSQVNGSFIYRNYNMGVQLDIFPLDNWVKDGAQQRFDSIDAKIRDLSTWMRMNNPKLAPADLERVKTWSGIDPMIVYEEMISIATQYNTVDTEYVTMSNSCTVYHYTKLTWKRAWFDGEKRTDFLGYEFPIPIAWDNVLKTTYGDWHLFPPIEKRGTWHTSLYVDPDTPYINFVKKIRELGGGSMQPYRI